MKRLELVVLLSGAILWSEAFSTGNTTRSVLSRRRRYVAFPEGSSVSAAICMIIGVISKPTDFLTSSVNWGVAYDLPSFEWARQHSNGFSNKPKAVVQRRSRRDLYQKLEIIVDNMGFPGTDCISRALCESGQFLKDIPKIKGNMVEELIKIIFSFPSEELTREESAEHHHYAHVYRRAKRSRIDCSVEYAGCQISLLDLILGRYSMPVQNLPQNTIFM
ncbi:uncharacterized protein LOC133336026 [Musca vetustissima]|uniref:uncharacterized protein LOC133336026 n=1 Tax=Musca vetustissima TaxID=27455 RepID=UPI002AB6657D|nr:uncharacterized protein LOC133336026 [Musca vetustissima]